MTDRTVTKGCKRGFRRYACAIGHGFIAPLRSLRECVQILRF